MALAYTALRDEVEQALQDNTNTNFSTGELDNAIKNASKEAGRIVPHTVQVSFTIESRTGNSTSTSANNLVDATESQFVSTDVGKHVYNKTEKTWAVITSYSSATQVGLSKDIFTVNDEYKIYNAGCTKPNQINISDVDDYEGIERVEYPIGQPRNWELNGTILTILVNSVDDSKVTTSGDKTYTEVLVWFNKRHLVSQLTDLAGAVNNAGGYAAAATTMAINGLQGSGTIEQGQEFTISNVRGTYTLTADATIASSAATVIFFPGLESTAANTTGITFVKSTLTPKLEPPVIQLSAGLAAVSKVTNPYQQTLTAITTLATAATAITSINARIAAATVNITSGITAIQAGTTATAAATVEFALINAEVDAATTRTAAATVEIAKIVTEVALAASALVSATALINTIPVGGGAGDWWAQASGNISVAQGRMYNGQSFLQAAQATLSNGQGYRGSGQASLEAANTDRGLALSYFESAAGEIRNAQARVQEAVASMNKAAHELQITRAGNVMEQWGQAQIKEAKNTLRAMSGLVVTSSRHPRD